VHAHFLIPGDLQLAQAAREGSYTGPADGVWSPETATTFMDAHHIQMQMLSFRYRWAPGPRATSTTTPRQWWPRSRAFRDARQHPLGRPGPPDAAPREIDRAANGLRADGFVLVTNWIHGLRRKNERASPDLGLAPLPSMINV
jgi:hypothetical protein